MINKNFVIILGIQMIGALVIAGVLLSDRLTEVAALMFLVVSMTIITLLTMSFIAYILRPKKEEKNQKLES